MSARATTHHTHGHHDPKHHHHDNNHHHHDNNHHHSDHGDHSDQTDADQQTSSASSGTPRLSDADRHLVLRFSYGLTRDLVRDVDQAGGAERWFLDQLHPERIGDGDADRLSAWWPSLTLGASDLWARNVAKIEYGYAVMQSYQRRLLLRRMTSRRQLLEVMTEFWENHLAVPVMADNVFPYRVPYGDVVRANALGRFDQLLQAAITHPAMLCYLNAAVSTAAAPNENLGRELLELHTVGVGYYTENDVKASARILTGWRVDIGKTWVASYQPTSHAVGPVTVMGFADPNASTDGRDLTMRYLSYLAHHPATAQRIATKLCVKFVRDDPPAELVEHLAEVYLQSNTAIVPVLKELIASRQFKRSAGRKLRDPGEDVVATYRALDVRLRRPPAGPPLPLQATTIMLGQMSALGTTPHAWPQPSGQPIDNATWSTPGRMLGSMSLHCSLAARWVKVGARYRRPPQWLPSRHTTLDELVDHLAWEILGRSASADLQKACTHAVGYPQATAVDPAHPIVTELMPRLLVTVLDSPDFLAR